MVGALLTPHPKMRASALGDFSLPTAQEGRAVPVIYGTVMIKGGNTVWWGDLKAVAIHQGLLATIMSFGRAQIIGYKYFLGVQFCLCHGPVDALVGIQANVQNLAYNATTILNGNGTENYIQLEVNSPNLFGGTVPGGQGGISGEIRFYRGIATQQPDDYLAQKQNRVVTDQSGIGYTFAGTGNGTMSSLAAGAAALNETISVICNGVNTNINDPNGHYQKAFWKIAGSISGTLVDTDSDDAGGCWSDTAFTGSPDRIDFTINTGSTQFAGGDTFTVVTLHSTQTPSYAGICQAVFKHTYLGISSYPKPMAFVLRRCPDGLNLGAGVANISGDANGAEIIYDLLTSTDYGMSVPPGRIDAAGSFTSAAQTLATEGLGTSFQFDTQETADNIISEVLRHIDGLLYTDPATGLWTLTLARANYNPATLPVFTVDNVLETVDFSRGSWQETSNLVGINFTSRANNFNQRLVRAYDAANIQITGEVRPQTIEFAGITQESTAGLVATRVLKTLTYPLAKIKIVVNRAGWNLRPGGVFKLTWTPLGIVNDIFRITRIGYGTLQDGKVTIDAVEDIFGIEDSAFVAPPVSGWVNPLGAPTAPAAQELVEAPYHLLAGAGMTEGIYAMAACARNEGTDKSYECWLNEGNGFFLGNEIFAFTPIGLLAAEYSPATPATDPTGFNIQITGQIDLDELASCTAADLANGLNLLLIDQEFMSWETVTANADGSYTISGIMRGVLDTVPADHAAGATVWFLSSGAGVAKSVPYAADTTVTAKLLPKNAFGELPISSATQITLATNSRYARPYPPGKLQMQGAAYGTRYARVYGDLAATWVSRNRLTQTAAATVIAQDAADIAGETGQTFTAKAVINGTTVRTVTGLAVENYTYTALDRVVDSTDGTKTVTLEIFSHVGSLDSFQPQSLVTLMTGFGFDFGQCFGGIQQ